MVIQIEDMVGDTVPKEQPEVLVGRASVDFDGFYEQRNASVDAGDLVVVTTDGKGVPMRRESLRKQTREVAAKRETKGQQAAEKG